MRRRQFDEFVLLLKLRVLEICLAVAFVTFVVIETIHFIRFLLKAL